MNRKSFMAELEAALTDRLPNNEIREVLSDYGEFFESGLAEGNSEEQVAERLGDPVRIALSLLGREHSLSHQGAPAVQTSGAAQTPPKAAIHRRLAALADDILLAGLPFIWFAPRIAIIAFFMPQYVPATLISIFGTVRISNHGWIAAARPFWLIAIVLSGIWFFVLSPVCLMLFRGQTLGKRMFGLRVANAAGGTASAVQYMVRELLGKLGLNMLCGLIWPPLAYAPALASLVWSLVSRDGMTVWDAIAGTRVVEVAPPHREEA